MNSPRPTLEPVATQTRLRRILASLRLQLRHVFLLSAYPHPDSFTYPSRQRMLIISAGLTLGSLLYGAYSFYYFYQNGISYWFNGLIALLSFAFFFKVLLRRGARLNDKLIYAILLNWALPVFFFVHYFAVAGGHPALEHLCLAILFYTNLLHWRVSSIGLLIALALGFLCKLCLSFEPIAAPWIDTFFISSAISAGLLNTYSFSALERERQQQTHRILRVIGQQLQKPLGIQLALSEALRYEANAASESKIENRLFELAEKLDARANQTRIALENLNHEDQTLQNLGATQLLHLRALGEPIRLELNKSYGWNLPAPTALISVDCDDDVYIQGELTEVVQTLASVIALILRPRFDQIEQEQDNKTAQQPILRISAKNDGQNSHLEYKLVEGEAAPSAAATKTASKQFKLEQTDAEKQLLSNAYWMNKLNRANHNAVGDLLPAYSLFVLNKLEARIRLEEIENGAPKHIHILFPLPRQYSDRNKDVPGSLLDMYK